MSNAPSTNPRGQRPRMGKMPAAVAYSGRSKSRIYEWGQEFPELFRKDGASTLIDFDVLDRILDALPIKEPAASGSSRAIASA